MLDTQAAAAERLGFFMRWIGGSALGVSGLGIVAMTWISVRERTREIGTRRALGATSAEVFLLVQCEHGSLALLGGLLGTGLSRPTSRLLRARLDLPFVFDRQMALVAFGIAGALNLAFALLSSQRAASISSMEALRYQ